MYLCYINRLGPNYKGELIYEFIFTNNVDDVIGDDWDRFPANGYPSFPKDNYIQNVLTLTTYTLDLTLAKDNEFFTYNDCKDGIIAIAWEDNNYVDNRIIVKFGDSIEDVKSKFYNRDFFLDEVN